jgi:hypothetical protein
MAATVHFAPALANGGLILGRTQVVTQATGLVEVSAEYIARQADLPRVVDRFFLDAPPPIFPTASISPRNLQQGALFMVNYAVSQEYGIATITARYAGVTSKPIVPYRTFDYVNFTSSNLIFVSLTGAFGGSNFVKAFGAEENNDYLRNFAATVSLKGRAEQTRFTFAALADAPQPNLPPPAKDITDAVSEIESGAVRARGGFTGFFGGEFTFEAVDPLPLAPGATVDPVTGLISPPKVSPLQVITFAAEQNGLNHLSEVTAEQWADRGIRPQGYYSIAKRNQAITPSVFIREITYIPRVALGA